MITRPNPVNWQTFKSMLEQYPDLHLHFQYETGRFVHPSFHITEIRQAPIVSVDCGGIMNKWTEVIVQLWEPPLKEADRSMQVEKALEIVNLVEKLLPLNPDAIVKIEFGNSTFDTRQMYPGELLAEGGSFIINLVPDFTQCKALSRNQSCGTVTADASACGQVSEKKEFEYIQPAVCKPDTGCC